MTVELTVDEAVVVTAQKARRTAPTAKRLLLAVVMLCTSVAVATDARPVEAATEIRIARVGPRGPVTVIGDSVLLGSGLNTPTLPDQLSAQGWGPIRYRASGSATSGLFAVPDEFRSSFWIDRWQAEGWDPKHVIVNLGTNDSGFCRTDLDCAISTITHMVDAIGPGREIWWPTITKRTFEARDTFNEALRIVEAERSNFHVWDWLNEFTVGGYSSGDLVHLNPDGYRRRSQRMAEEFTRTFSGALRVGDDAPLPEPAGPLSSFVPVAGQRVVDTRSEAGSQTNQGGSRVAAGERLRVDLDGVLPDDATAAALYIAAARASDDGFLSAGPCDAPVSGSVVNYRAGLPAGAPAIAAVGADRAVCITASTDTDLIVDVQGAFQAGTDGLSLIPLPTPVRQRDTRQGERTNRIVIDASVRGPVDAAAINLTAIGADDIGFLTAGPCGEPPDTAALNYSPGAPISASAIVPVGADGTFCVDSSASVDIVIDTTGVFVQSGGLAFVPSTPTRMLDTRSGVGGWAPRHGANQTIDIRVAPPEAAAVTGTLTLVRPNTNGFATGFRCAVEPANSSVNAPSGLAAANSLTNAVSNGRLCVLSSAQAQTLFDTTGWWVQP